MKEIDGTEKVWPAQLVLIAMGFLGPVETIVQELSLTQDKRSNIAAAEGAYATSVPGVFAPATRGAGRVSSCGPSAKAATQPSVVSDYLTGKY
jgi:glutamate synthase (NADPH/NADH) small chain